MIRYQSVKPDDAPVRRRLHELAKDRPVFGVKRRHTMLRRDGLHARCPGDGGSMCASSRLERGPFLQLAGGEWIRQRQTLLIVGPTGTGKTWLACALGQSACRQGHTVRYVRLPRLLSDELVLARADGSYGKLMQTMAKTDLLILDDWGLAPLGDRERRDLLELVEERAGRRATLVTSQLPIEHWHEMIGDATFGDAILDRLVHHAHRLTLTGGSLRRLAPTTKSPTPHAD
jgi:DNA replication protein DnaC